MLSGVGLQLAVLRLDFKDVPGIAERTAELQTMLERAMAQIRELSNGLNPSVVERSGLHFAVEALVKEAQGFFSGGVRLHFIPTIRLPRNAANVFYRIAKYAIGYAKRSGTASQIDISVKEQHNAVSLEARVEGAPYPPLGEDSAARI